MFSEEIINNYITHGNEEINLEYKNSMNWTNRNCKFEIIRVILAMSNNSDGGVIVLGVEDKTFKPVGMNEGDYNSFKHDLVADKLKNYCDPVVEFDLLSDTAIIEGEEKKFVVIQVKENIELTICIKSEKNNPSIDMLPANIALRENAVYIRSKTPIGSREPKDSTEWRKLIEKTVEKNKNELLKRLPCADFVGFEKESESDKHNKDLPNYL